MQTSIDLLIARKSWLRDASIQLWTKAERHALVDIEQSVLTFLKEQRADVAKELRRLGEEKPGLAAKPGGAERIVDEAFDPEEWDKDLRTAVGAAVARTIIRGYLAAKAVQVGRRRRFPPVWRKGGPGSGNFGHAGRPGEVGGSASAEGAVGETERQGGKESTGGGKANPKIEAWAMAKFGSEEKGKAFAKWFGDSKVVDEEGNPQIVYHGNAGNATNLDPTERVQSEGTTTRIAGIYLTSDPDMAAEYAERNSRGELGQFVVPSYVSIQNPYIVTLTKPEDYTREVDSLNADRLLALSIKGHDGVIIHANIPGSYGVKRQNLEIVAFKTTQIKSAIGNRGTFDPDDPDINKSVKRGWADIPITEEEQQAILSFELPASVTRRVLAHTGEIMSKPYWKDVNETERQRMLWSIQEGIEEGRTLKQIADSIAKDIDTDEVRAKRIATTEVTGAYSAGAIVEAEEGEAAGLTIIKTWANLGDDKVRDTHVEADGQVVVGAAGLFEVGGFKTPRPGWPDLPAEERCGCRCLMPIEPLMEGETIPQHIEAYKAAVASVKGGPGSGNFGHAGRPGELGGSGPGGDGHDTASELSDIGESFHGPVEDYTDAIRGAVNEEDPERSGPAAYAALDQFKQDFRDKVDEWRDSVMEAGDRLGGRGDVDKLQEEAGKLIQEFHDAAEEVVDLPGDYANALIEEPEPSEAAGRLEELHGGLQDRLYGIASDYLASVPKLDEGKS